MAQAFSDFSVSCEFVEHLHGTRDTGSRPLFQSPRPHGEKVQSPKPFPLGYSQHFSSALVSSQSFVMSPTLGDGPSCAHSGPGLSSILARVTLEYQSLFFISRLCSRGRDCEFDLSVSSAWHSARDIAGFQSVEYQLHCMYLYASSYRNKQ